MLLLDDEDELPATPSEGEKLLGDSLGPAGLRAIDDAVRGVVRRDWRKVAMVAVQAIDAGGHTTAEDQVQLHVRRIIALVEAGVLESQGNLRRPRFSEVRLPALALVDAARERRSGGDRRS